MAKDSTPAADAPAAPAASSSTPSAPAVEASTADVASQLAADASALAAKVAARDQVEAPSIVEQQKAGVLPDPVELALKARGASGSARRLDETIPGGLTVHPDGYFKNAEGQEVTANGEVVEGGNQPRIDLSGARVERL